MCALLQPLRLSLANLIPVKNAMWSILLLPVPTCLHEGKQKAEWMDCGPYPNLDSRWETLYQRTNGRQSLWEGLGALERMLAGLMTDKVNHHHLTQEFRVGQHFLTRDKADSFPATQRDSWCRLLVAPGNQSSSHIPVARLVDLNSDSLETLKKKSGPIQGQLSQNLWGWGPGLKALQEILLCSQGSETLR